MTSEALELPKEWQTWHDIVAWVPPKPYVYDPEARWLEDPCDGPGSCHGCMSWCWSCGDVVNVCDSDQGPPGPGCDIHDKYPSPNPLPNLNQLLLSY